MSQRIALIADLHLTAEQPLLNEWLLAGLSAWSGHADALYILGDLFEAWAGDDDDAAWLQPIRAALRQFSQKQPVYFIAGNRDFLLGQAFAADTGMQLLPDPSLIQVGSRRILLTHGDTLCTDDVAYQTFRQQVRHPAFQAQFLAQPLAQRRAVIGNYREMSELAKQGKTMDIMDVNAEAVQQLLAAHDYPLLVHGHTHRPAQHQWQAQGRALERWVLPNWTLKGGGVLWIDELQIEQQAWPG